MSKDYFYFVFILQKEIHLLEYTNRSFYLGVFREEVFVFCQKQVARARGDNIQFTLTPASYKLNDKQTIDSSYTVLSIKRFISADQIEQDSTDECVFKENIRSYLGQ